MVKHGGLKPSGKVLFTPVRVVSEREEKGRDRKPGEPIRVKVEWLEYDRL